VSASAHKSNSSILGAQEYDQETKDYEVERHAVFWSDDGCKSLYKNHLRCVEYPARAAGAFTYIGSAAALQRVLSVCCLPTFHDRHPNRTLVERTNSISGRKYRDDATIFAWDLVNEPRCETWRVSVMTSAAFCTGTAAFAAHLNPADASGITRSQLARRCRSARRRCPPGSTRWRPS
jgi:hypothetical protein